MNTLLIVEDEKLIRQGIKTMIQRSGVPVEQILEASNGLDALELLKANQGDVMFTDIRMPKMDGIEFSKTIRENDKDIPILIITAKDEGKTVSDEELLELLVATCNSIRK